MWTAPAISLWAPWTQHFCGRGVWHFSKIPQNLACLLQNSLFCCSQVLDVFWFGFLFSPSPFLAETSYLLCVFPLREVGGEFLVQSTTLWYVAWEKCPVSSREEKEVGNTQPGCPECWLKAEVWGLWEESEKINCWSGPRAPPFLAHWVHTIWIYLDCWGPQSLRSVFQMGKLHHQKHSMLKILLGV